MSMLFSRTALVSVWLVVFAVFTLSVWPVRFDRAALLLIVGMAAPVIMLLLRKERSPTVTEVLHHIDASGKS